MEKTQNVDMNISIWSVVKVALVVIGLWLLYLLRDVIAIVFISLILAASLETWVDWLHQRRVPRLVGVLSLYVVIILFTSILFTLLFPPLVEQLRNLSSAFPHALQQLGQALSEIPSLTGQTLGDDQVSNWLGSLSGIFSGNAGNVLTFFSNFFGGIVSLVITLIMTLYIVVEQDAILRAVRSVIPVEHSERVGMVITKVQKKIGNWLQGQLVLGIIIALLSYFGLLVLGMPNALALAMFAGLTELVPILGPVIGAIPAIIIAFSISPLKALFVFILYVIIQQSENHFIVPQVMRKAVGLNPLVSIIALLAGARLGGITGALLAIPVTTALTVLGEEFFTYRKADKI